MILRHRHLRVLALFAASAAALPGCGARRGPDRLAPGLGRPLPPAAAEAPVDGGAGRTPDLGPQPGLEDYLRYAALNNPGLKAAFDRWRAAVERVPQVRALPDPRLSYRYFIKEVETRVGAQRNGLGVAQMFPWFGKLALRGDASAEAARAEYQRFEAARLKLFYRVREEYYEYYYLAQAIRTVRENLQLLENVEPVLRSRYKTATATHPDLVRLQVEMGKLDDRLRELRDLRGPIVARLNAALNRPPAAELPWPEQIPNPPLALSDAELLAWLNESNPELRALGHEIARSERMVELAKKDYYPDITIGLDWVDTAHSTSGRHPDGDGKDPLVAMVSVNLPIWREKLDAALREAKYRLRAARRRQREMANSLSADLKLVTYRLRDAERKIDLYRDTLLPKAREGLKVTLQAFQAARATFTDLIDAERILLDFELAYQRALANKAQRLAELEMLVGREIPAGGNESRAKSVQTPGSKPPATQPAATRPAGGN